MSVELGLKILRRKDSLGDDLAAQIRHVVPLEIGKNSLGVSRPFVLPIDRELAQMGHRREHVESFASGRRQTRIGTSGRVQIEREIVGQAASRENIGEQLAVARSENN